VRTVETRASVLRRYEIVVVVRVVVVANVRDGSPHRDDLALCEREIERCARSADAGCPARRTVGAEEKQRRVLLREVGATVPRESRARTTSLAEMRK